MGTWTNNDGLYIKYGTSEAEVTTGGSYGTGVAGMHVTEVVFDATALGASAAIQADTTVIPSGVILHKVEVIADVAATSGGSAVLNVGLIRLDRSTELDYDGIIAALPVANMGTIGELTTLSQDVTYSGALIGTTTANAGLITADYDTAAFTAGTIRVKIYWYKA